MRWPWSKKTEKPVIQRRVIGRGEGCLISRKSTDDGFGVFYIDRSEPEHELDSGWCFSHGTEDESYVNTPSNWVPYHIDTAAELFPETKEHLKAPVGSAFYWDGSKFVPDPLGSPNMPPMIH